MIKTILKSIMLVAAAAATQAYAQTAVTGFVDAQYLFNEGDGVEGAGADNSFLIRDGAVYVNHKVGSSELVVDLPFGTSGTDNDFAFAEGEPQAYIKNTYDFGLSWQLGQFDKIYGLEANDTLNNFFAGQSIVFQGSGGRATHTHTGLFANYNVMGLDLGLLIANGQGDGFQDTTADVKNEMGARVGWKNDMIRVAGTLLMTGAESDALETEQLIDVVIGVMFGPITVEGNYQTLTADGGVDTADATAMLAQVIYKMNDTLGFGVRYASTDAEDAGGDKLTQISAVVNHKMNKNLTCKAEVTQNTNDTTGADSSMEGAIAAVYGF